MRRAKDKTAGFVELQVQRAAQVAQLVAEQVLHADLDPFDFPPLTDMAKVESSRLTRRLLHSGQRTPPAASRLSHNCSNLWSHAWQWNSYNGIERAFPARPYLPR